MKFAVEKAKACLLILVMTYFTVRFLLNQLSYENTIYCRVLDAKLLKPKAFRRSPQVQPFNVIRRVRTSLSLFCIKTIHLNY
jgi:hypothetical protein